MKEATCSSTTYRRGTAAAFRLGAGHGVFCVGCCWALMLVAFAAGVANLWWMAALTAVMVFEKTGRGGRRGVRPIGVGLIVLALLTLAQVSGRIQPGTSPAVPLESPREGDDGSSWPGLA